jgi:acyl-CoA thioester hydrolase
MSTPQVSINESTPARKLIHVEPHTVLWGDMDALGHVNNARYLTYFEHARLAWSNAAGYALNNTSAGMILAKATVNYRKPIVYPARLKIEMYAQGAGRTSFVQPLIIRDADSGDVYAEGECVIVWFDYVAMKPIGVPDELRKLLSVE